MMNGPTIISSTKGVNLVYCNIDNMNVTLENNSVYFSTEINNPDAIIFDKDSKSDLNLNRNSNRPLNVLGMINCFNNHNIAKKIYEMFQNTNELQLIGNVTIYLDYSDNIVMEFEFPKFLIVNNDNNKIQGFYEETAPVIKKEPVRDDVYSQTEYKTPKTDNTPIKQDDDIEIDLDDF